MERCSFKQTWKLTPSTSQFRRTPRFRETCGRHSPPHTPSSNPISQISYGTVRLLSKKARTRRIKNKHTIGRHLHHLLLLPLFVQHLSLKRPTLLFLLKVSVVSSAHLHTQKQRNKLCLIMGIFVISTTTPSLEENTHLSHHHHHHHLHLLTLTLHMSMRALVSLWKHRL